MASDFPTTITSASDEFAIQSGLALDQATKIISISFRKIAYLVMIDALAKVRFPEIDHDNRLRFTSLVREHGAWDDADRVSLPQAELVLQLDPKATEQGRLLVKERLATWSDKFQPLASNPKLEEFTTEDMPIVACCQHVELLWQFRNTLMHEFRHPASSDDEVLRLGAETAGYFLIEGRVGPTWELVLPWRFLETIAETCRKGVLTWLRATQRDPWDSFYDGRVWPARYQREPHSPKVTR